MVFDKQKFCDDIFFHRRNIKMVTADSAAKDLKISPNTVLLLERNNVNDIKISTVVSCCVWMGKSINEYIK